MRALVLSSGSERGAFQAGALKYLLGELKTNYSLICGVSVGAINSAIIGQYKQGEELEASNKLISLWNNISINDIYKPWRFFGRAFAPWKLGLFDGSPLTNLIKNNVCIDKIHHSRKKIIVGATSLSSGRYILFDQDHPNFIEAVNASASFPLLIPPVKIGNNFYIDGGAKEYSPIKTAINNGADEIDIIITNPQIRINKFIKNPNMIDIINRSFDILIDKIMNNDIEKLLLYNKLSAANLSDKKLIKYRIIQPEVNLIENLMKFDKVDIKNMIDIGYQRCKEVITNASSKEYNK